MALWTVHRRWIRTVCLFTLKITLIRMLSEINQIRSTRTEALLHVVHQGTVGFTGIGAVWGSQRDWLGSLDTASLPWKVRDFLKPVGLVRGKISLFTYHLSVWESRGYWVTWTFGPSMTLALFCQATEFVYWCGKWSVLWPCAYFSIPVGATARQLNGRLGNCWAGLGVTTSAARPCADLSRQQVSL